MPHPDEGLIHAWLDGELDPAEAARVEALVASDEEWAAAAAEARGLIAASVRIVRALDSVPANVIPGQSPRRNGPRRWAWRAAAVLALIAGSAVLLERRAPELPTPKLAAQRREAVMPAAPVQPANPPAPKVMKRAFAAASGQDQPAAKDKSSNSIKELDSTKSFDAMRAQGTASAGRDLRVAAAAAPAPSPAVPGVPGTATEKFVRVQPSCFEQRAPADSAMRIIRLTAGALADSIRLEKFVVHGDTLSAVNRPLTAVRVRCPEL
jgi:hypothetical protein